VPWPVYTKTFLRHTGPTTWWEYRVPLGHMAVVTSCVATIANVQTGQAFVYGAELPLWFASFQVAYTNQIGAMRSVVRANERIQIYLSVAGMSCWVSGYLFSDSAPAPGQLPAPPAVGSPPATGEPWELLAA